MCIFSEEAADIIASQHRKKESGTLAAYEEQLNDVSRERECAMEGNDIYHLVQELQVGIEREERKVARKDCRVKVRRQGQFV